MKRAHRFGILILHIVSTLCKLFDNIATDKIFEEVEISNRTKFIKIEPPKNEKMDFRLQRKQQTPYGLNGCQLILEITLQFAISYSQARTHRHQDTCKENCHKKKIRQQRLSISVECVRLK